MSIRAVRWLTAYFVGWLLILVYGPSFLTPRAAAERNPLVGLLTIVGYVSYFRKSTRVKATFGSNLWRKPFSEPRA